MGTLKNTLIELKELIDLAYVDLEQQGTFLESVSQEYSVLASVGEPCINSCNTNYDSSPTYVFPSIPTPNGVIVFGTPLVGYTAINQPFSYTGTDANSFTAKVNGVSIGTVTSPINLTGLVMGTLYTIEVTPINTHGTGTPASTNVTTLDWALGQLPTNIGGSLGFITFGVATVSDTEITQPFTYSASDAIGFLFKLNNGSALPITSPVELTGLTEATVYNLKVAAVTNYGIGVYASKDVQTLTLPNTPQGNIIFGIPTVTHNSIIQPFTYTENDADFFIASVSQEIITPLGTVTSPITLSNLNADTVYTISVTPVNAVGSGNTFSTSPKTLESPLVTALKFLTVEMYYTTFADIALISEDYAHNLAFNERIDNFGKFRVTFNNVDVGVINLNNGGGNTHPYNDEYNYPPSPPVMATGWSGSPYARYAKIELNLQQALAVGNSTYIPPSEYADYLKINIIPLATDHPDIPITHVITRCTVRQNATTVSNILITRMSKTTDFYIKVLNIGG